MKRASSHRGKAGGKRGEEKRASRSVKRAKTERQPDRVPLERESSSSSSTNEEKKPRAGTFVAGDPRINRTKAGPGRPTDKFKRWCAKVIADPRTRKAVRRVLHNPRNKAQTSMWKAVASHAHGQPTAHVDMTHKVTLEDLLSASHEEKDS